MMGFSLGCAIWAYKEWVGDLYPQGSKPSEFLSLYSRRLTAVEGNTTFYSVPSEAIVQRWVQSTPATFKFCLKLPQTITHQGPLMPRRDAAIAFLDRIAPLGQRLGPLLMQLPPSYGVSYLDDLTTFLQTFPHDPFQLSVEVRHPDWFKSMHANRLNQVLTELESGRALLDSRPIYECNDDPQVQSKRRKPNVSLQPITTASFSIIRYISHPVLANNQPYLSEWVAQVAQWYAQGIDVYFFVHCPIEARSPSIARFFQSQIDQTGLDSGIQLPPLPWNQGIQLSTQLSLF